MFSPRWTQIGLRGEQSTPEQLEVVSKSAASNEYWPGVEASSDDDDFESAEFRGFSMGELNRRFFTRRDQILNGKPSAWDELGEYFIYWQSHADVPRWAISSAAGYQAVLDQQLPGFAYRQDARHWSHAFGWCELYGQLWKAAPAVTVKAIRLHRVLQKLLLVLS